MNSTGEASWWSNEEERQNQEKNQQEVAESETPLTPAMVRTTGEKQKGHHEIDEDNLPFL